MNDGMEVERRVCRKGQTFTVAHDRHQITATYISPICECFDHIKFSFQSH